MAGITTDDASSAGKSGVPSEDGPVTGRVILGVSAVVATSELAAASALMVATSLPQISQTFDRADVSWTFTSSALFAAVIVGLVGKAADLYGKRKVFLALALISVVGSVISAVASDYNWFIVGRALQGATYVMPAVGFSLIRDVFPKKAVMVGISVVFTGSGVFIVLAPFAAGWLINSFGVLSIFWATAIVAALLTVAVPATTPESPIRVPARLNYVGAALLGIGTGLIIYSVGQGSTWGWGSGKFLGMLALGLVSYVAWVLWDSKFSDPLIDFKLLRARRMVWVLIATALVYATFNPIVSVIPSLLQTPPAAGSFGFGLDANGVALFQIPYAVFLIGGGVLIGVMATRWGVKVPFAVGMAVLAVSVFFLSTLPSSNVEVWTVLAGVGIGFGLCFAAIPNMLMQAAPMERQGIASVMQNVVSNIASGSALQVTFSLLGAHAVVTEAGGFYYDGMGYQTVFRMLAVVALVGVAVGLLLPLGRKKDVQEVDAGDRAAVVVAEEINDREVARS